MKYSPLSLAALYAIFALRPSEFEHSGSRQDGHYYKVYFPNGFGASIIKHSGSYGREDDLFEVAVLFEGDICYRTPITNDVVGYLTDEDVAHICRRISDLELSDLCEEDDEW